MPRVSASLHLPDDEPYQIVLVKKDKDGQQFAYVIARTPGKLYVHYFNTDKRLDEWISDSTAELVNVPMPDAPPPPPRRGNKRKRASLANGRASQFGGRSLTADGSEEDDVEERQWLTGRRNFDYVNFGEWQINTWYFSPYPITEQESEELSHSGANPTNKSLTQSSDATPNGTPPISKARRVPSKGLRTTPRSHGRTADMLAGGLNRDLTRDKGEPSALWVCDRCFKYMTEALPFELHAKTCNKGPPGKAVYENGAYQIYEIDGAAEKLYCQNLSLFGKLFIDVKTLFFDCENCVLFYVLIEAQSKRDVVYGFFSKEKVSFDDYNLACILVLPPYQRGGHGRSLIEFSYFLSRRAGVIGAPEQPLSDLGLRSYLSYWIAALVRFFRGVLQITPAELSKLSGNAIMETSIESTSRGKKKDTEFSESTFEQFRRLTPTSNSDGSVTLHVSIECTLEDLAKATAIRAEDIALALTECGLLQFRKIVMNGEEENQIFMISREMVEKVAEERRVQPNIIDPSKFHST